VIINIAGCLGGLSAGVIAESLKNWEAFWLFKTFRGYDILFAVSAVMRLLAVVIFLPFIKDATPADDAGGAIHDEQTSTTTSSTLFSTGEDPSHDREEPRERRKAA